MVNREGIPSFCTNEHKVFIWQLPVLPIYNVYHINIYTCVVSLQSRRNALNEHFDTISCTVHVFNVLVGNVIKWVVN